MSFKGLLSCILFVLCPGILLAQQNHDPIIEYIIESVAENQNEDFDYTELVERLNYYRKYPINLNKTSKEQLNELVFLNPLQINNLIDHISTNGKLIDVLELQSIEGYDLQTIRTLLSFASINIPTGFENFSLKNLKKDGSNDLLIRYGRIIEEQQGFAIPASADRSRYLGSPDRVFSRYRFSYQNNIQFSLNMEKDAGEQFWNNTLGKNGPDFISSSLFIKNLRSFKKIVLGDFALQFGQGLTLWSGASFGKGADIFSIAKQDLGLRAYTSINEFSYFRGAATQINFGNFDLTTFISYRKLDAGLSSNKENNLDKEISSLPISGLHRTPNELANKNVIDQLIYGSNLQYNYRKLSLGLTVYQSNYSNNFAPGNALYNQFDFTGRNLTNTGFNYSYTISNAYFFGEVAHSLNSGVAYLNGVIASLSPNISALIFHRNYQKDYYSYYNQGVGESNLATNEKGFYGGFQVKSGKKIDYSFYTDFFRFPWLKFRVDAPSTGYEIFNQFSYSPNRGTKFIIRYKFEEKQQNASTETVTNTLESIKRQNYRIELQHQINKSFSIRNRAEVVQFKKGSAANQYGFLIYQDVNYNPLSSDFSGNFRFALFDTEGFDTRVYAYENDVLYSFSIPGLQNQGIRFYINGRYNLRKGLDFWLKYALTKYNNLDNVGSGLDEIKGSLKSDIKAQIRYQF